MFRLARTRSTSLLALIVAGTFGIAHADEPAPAPPPVPVDEPPTDSPAPAADSPAPTPPPAAETSAPVEPAPPPVQAAPVPPATLRGSVIDNNTKAGLPAAVIQVQGVVGGDLTLATELDGTYTLELPPGTYSVIFSTPEYVEQARTITVTSSQRLDLNLNLDPVPATGTADASRSWNIPGERSANGKAFRPSP